MRKNLTKTLALLLVMALAVCVCGACATPAVQTPASNAPASETTASETPTSDASPESESSPSGELDKIIMCFPRSYECLDDAHIHAAIEMGYFEENGIEVVFEQAYGTDDLSMIIAGQAHTGYPSSFVQIAGHEAGLPFKSVYQVDNVNIFGYSVRPDSGIDSISDLKGKTIALGDPAWNTISDPILIAAGVQPSEVTYVTAGETRAQMVDAGQADAVLTWYKEFELWNGQGITLDYLPGEDVLQLTGGCLVFANDFVDDPANHDLIGRFVKAYAMGAYFTYMNPVAATEITMNKFPSLDVDFEWALMSINNLIYIDNGEDVEKNGYGWHNPEKWDVQMEACRNGGTLTRTDLTHDEIYTNDFVEVANSFDKKRVEEDAMNYKVAPEHESYVKYGEPRS